MEKYDVRITVVQQIIVPVEAENMAQAKALAELDWHNDEYTLDSSHPVSISFETLYPEFGAYGNLWNPNNPHCLDDSFKSLFPVPPVIPANALQFDAFEVADGMEP